MSEAADQPTPVSQSGPTPSPASAKPKSPFSTSDIKTANKPMLVHQRWKAKQAAAAAAAAETKEGKTKADGRAYVRHGSGNGGGVLWQVVKVLVGAVLASVFLSRAVTNTWAWGYGTQYNSIDKIRHRLFPPPLRAFSLPELALHDGAHEGVPVYLALDGDVYDVSRGNGPRSYGPGGGYHIFAGRDAARAFVTGCFGDPDHLTYDLRGLDEGQIGALKGWKKFYENHADYRHIGTLARPPIDPASPVPQACNARQKPGH